MDQEERLTEALADRYRIEREIGSGGMATVYLARDLKHKRQVAVKVLDRDLAESLGAERFLREIETAANLTHPHILPIHDSGEADGFLYYVMPYARGESLRSRLTKERQLPVGDAVQITREIADALAYAHREGVIHRDVKPANIMLEEGHAVLADFGVAQAVAEAKDARLTRTGTSLGTPSYMSPEQATGERDLDGRTDQYALGCVLYEMLAGYPPFTGAQVEAVVRQHLTQEPPSVTEARPSVSAEVEKVIRRALAKSPADRFRTTGEMAAALGRTRPGREVKGVSDGAKAAMFLATFLLGLVAVVLVVSRWPGGNTVYPEDLVAVFPFVNRTGDPDLAEIGAWAAFWISDELDRSLEAEAIDPLVVSQTVGAQEDDVSFQRLAGELGVGRYISGEITPRSDRLLFKARIGRTDRNGRGLLVEAEGSKEEVRGVLEDLKSRILTGLNIIEDEYLREWVSAPPTFDAWRIYSRAVPFFRAGDYQDAYGYYIQAYQTDTTFLDALYAAASAARNSGQYALLDSLVKMLDPRVGRSSPFKRVWVDHYHAVLKGDKEGELAIWRGEYQRRPDRVWKPFRVGMALLALGRPVEAIDWMEESDFDHPLNQPYRSFMRFNLAQASYFSGDLRESLNHARLGIEDLPSDLGLRYLQIRTLVALGRLDEAEELLGGLEEMGASEGWTPGLVLLRVSAHLGAFGYKPEGQRAAERAIDWFRAQNPNMPAQGEAEGYLFAGRPVEGMRILHDLAKESPEDLPTRALLGLALAQTGDTVGAEAEAAWISGLDRPYLFGADSYWQGAILAHLGRREEATALIRQSHEEGRSWVAFQNDPYLAPLRGYPAFERFMEPKG